MEPSTLFAVDRQDLDQLLRASAWACLELASRERELTTGLRKLLSEAKSEAAALASDRRATEGALSSVCGALEAPDPRVRGFERDMWESEPSFHRRFAIKGRTKMVCEECGVERSVSLKERDRIEEERAERLYGGPVRLAAAAPWLLIDSDAWDAMVGLPKEERRAKIGEMLGEAQQALIAWADRMVGTGE